jgi:uncharacterized membrane protein YgdD (TMEM256/DUF423 family)
LIGPTFGSTQIRLAAISGTVAVILGALGAHALKGHLTEIQLDAYKTASQYHFLHSLLIIGCGLISGSNLQFNPKRLALASKLLWLGMICFSGSIYLLTTRELIGLDGLRLLGPITPIGGILMAAGWLCIGLAFNSYKIDRK